MPKLLAAEAAVPAYGHIDAKDIKDVAFYLIAAALMTVLTELILVGQYVWLLRAEIRELNWGPLTRALLAVLMMGAVAILLRELPLLLNIAIGAVIVALKLAVPGH